MSRIDEIFRTDGIQVYTNTLGLTENIRKSYVGFTRKVLVNHGVSKSHHVKLNCYRELYPELESRKKLTGFEKFSNIDFNTRIKLKKLVTPNPDNSTAYDNNHQYSSTKEEYITLLVDEIKKDKREKILYFSGGLDSQLLAQIMLDNGIKFTPVIFKFVNDSNEVENSEEISYAFKFCEKHDIIPHVENINILNFWNSDELITLAKKFNIYSTHVLTHAKMVYIMNEKYSNFSHYFGGEVRYFIDIPRDETIKLDLVFSAKLSKNVLLSYISGGGGDFGSPGGKLYYGWTNMVVYCQGGGGAGGVANAGIGGGGGSGGQLRQVTLTKTATTGADPITSRVQWVQGLGGNAGLISPGTGEGTGTEINLYYDNGTNNAAGSSYKTIDTYPGERGNWGNIDGKGGAIPQSNVNGSPIADNGTLPFISGSTQYGGNQVSNNGGGGAGTSGGGSVGTTTSGGDGANGLSITLTWPTGSSSGQTGAGGGGGAAPSTSNTGGSGGLGADIGSGFSGVVGGNGGAGTVIGGDGTVGLDYFGAGGGGQGGGSSPANGSRGQGRIVYWTA